MTAPFAGLDVRTFKELMVSAPAFLVEHLLAREDAWSRAAIDQLCHREWPLPLAPGTAAYAAISKRLPPGETPLQMGLPRPPLVWCLCVRNDPWADDVETRFGTVRWLRAEQFRPVNQSAFERSCTAGVSAALAWLQSRMPLGRLPTEWRFVPTGILGHPEQDPGPEGGSAGLAAALSVVASILDSVDIGLPRHLAATGIVAPDGRVDPIDWLKEKLAGIVREAPFIKQVFVPAGNAVDVPPGLPFDVVPVDSVKQALDRFWTAQDLSPFQARHSPEMAAEEALRLEMAQQHSQAMVLAGQVLEALGGTERSSRKRLLAAIQARTVRALNLTHRGLARKALEELNLIHDSVRVSNHQREMPAAYPLDLRALVAAAEASALLDCLEAKTGISVCGEYLSRLPELSSSAAIPLTGSLLRCQTAAGRLDEAESTWCIYSDLVEEPDQLPRMWCHRIELLVRRAATGHEEALDEAREALASGRWANNEVLSAHEQHENALFLDLAECRICALTGDADRALELAGPVPAVPARPWPNHHMHRFVAEALARAGRVDEALHRTGLAWKAIRKLTAGFLPVVLKTSAAVEALLRMEHGLDGWAGPAREFAGVYEAYRPGRIRWPKGSRGRSRWADCLRQALEEIPY